MEEKKSLFKGTDKKSKKIGFQKQSNILYYQEINHLIGEQSNFGQKWQLISENKWQTDRHDTQITNKRYKRKTSSVEEFLSSWETS